MCPIFHLLGYTNIHPDTSKLQIFYLFFTPFDKLVIWYSWIMSHVLLTALLNVHPSTAIRMMSVKYKIHACNMMQDIFLYYLRDKPEVCSINRWCFTCKHSFNASYFLFHIPHEFIYHKKTHKKILMKK